MTTQPTVLPGVAAWNDLRRGYHLTVPTYYNFAVDGIGRFAADPTHVALRHLALDGRESQLHLRRPGTPTVTGSPPRCASTG